MTIQDNILAIKQQINLAAAGCGRDPHDITLIAVSKTKTVDEIQAAIDCGQLVFGENYVQEGVDKINYFANPQLTWHFIGALQSNKTRPVAEHFDWVHTIDRAKIAKRLSEQRPANLGKLNVLIQINISDENSKSGIDPTQLTSLAAEINAMPNLNLRGIMAIPAPETDFDKQLIVGKKMAQLLLELKRHYPQVDTLSLGMTHDMVASIEAGSTMVRIGTAIFGPRNYHKP